MERKKLADYAVLVMGHPAHLVEHQLLRIVASAVELRSV